MRLLIVVTNADLAGAPIHVLHLVRGLRSRHPSIQVEACFGSDGPVAEILADMGIKTHIIKSLRSNLNPFSDLVSFLTLASIIRVYVPNVIHCHSSKAGFVGRLVAAIYRIATVYTIHGWGFGVGRKRLVSGLTLLAELVCAPFTSRYIAVSQCDRDTGLRSLRISSHKIGVIYNGSPDLLSLDKKAVDGFNVIMVARNSYQKDYSTFFRALRVASFNNAFVVGSGTSDVDFVDSARDLAGTASFSRIVFVGESDRVSDFLLQSSVFILSSRFEGLPISIVEALSMGLPILASHVGGVPELVIEGSNGFTFAPGDYASLADSINLLHSDERLLRSMGSASRKLFLREFGLDVMVDKTMEVYGELLSR
jgi:glycosyltransferase involved in cell wall biosynthesis